MPNSYRVSARSAAAPDAVYRLLLSAGTWPLWSPIDAAEVENGTDPGRLARVGDTRIFRTGRAVSRERVVELVTDRRFGYEIVGGRTFRSYRGLVELASDGRGGTTVTWSATFQPAVRFTGPFWEWFLTRFMRRMAAGLAAHAVASTAPREPDAGSDPMMGI
ncbi:SRPBCC family protein [Dactylosporangium sp. NPDC049140]|uniref:SRPBCC family protein n=1 Tax=Dactylosporangium sp. NPDC049140 TaxID=3155647 RepID=UPI0033EF5618